MVAVRVLVADAADLSELDVRSRSLIRVLLKRYLVRIVARLASRRAALLCEVLACQEQHLFVEAADNRNLGLSLSCRS